ncbi:MAG: anthranilate synthase component I family protein [Deltaproteobacteria bacterium]|nr:MAG: anthranilate synthase component I family protein [Deltaproteobacteria bacterium]
MLPPVLRHRRGLPCPDRAGRGDRERLRAITGCGAPARRPAAARRRPRGSCVTGGRHRGELRPARTAAPAVRARSRVARHPSRPAARRLPGPDRDRQGAHPGRRHLRDLHLQPLRHDPYSAYLRLPEVEVLSSSPERFLSLDRDRWVETRPMKGTRPRGRTPDEDRELSRQLAQSEKDRAENIMIVDLARNDLGRVCEFGSVTVPDLQVVETFAFTHQMVSTVRGRLLGAHTTIDLIAATFPGGSMTGAPKVEAMKIIDRLEPVKRGIFSGSIGYLDFEGMVGLNIVIRTLIKKGTALNFHVGGAIVSDSDAADEHQEILDKAAGLVAALEEYEAAGRPGSSP